MLHNIKVKAKEKGISIRKMCFLAEVDYTSMYRWDKQTPSVDKVYRVAKVLGCSIEDLLED